MAGRAALAVVRASARAGERVDVIRCSAGAAADADGWLRSMPPGAYTAARTVGGARKQRIFDFEAHCGRLAASARLLDVPPSVEARSSSAHRRLVEPAGAEELRRLAVRACGPPDGGRLEDPGPARPSRTLRLRAGPKTVES